MSAMCGVKECRTFDKEAAVWAQEETGGDWETVTPKKGKRGTVAASPPKPEPLIDSSQEGTAASGTRSGVPVPQGTPKGGRTPNQRSGKRQSRRCEGSLTADMPPSPAQQVKGKKPALPNQAPPAPPLQDMPVPVGMDGAVPLLGVAGPPQVWAACPFCCMGIFVVTLRARKYAVGARKVLMLAVSYVDWHFLILVIYIIIIIILFIIYLILLYTYMFFGTLMYFSWEKTMDVGKEEGATGITEKFLRAGKDASARSSLCQLHIPLLSYTYE